MRTFSEKSSVASNIKTFFYFRLLEALDVVCVLCSNKWIEAETVDDLNNRKEKLFHDQLL